FTPYDKGPNHEILGNLVKSLKEILATEKAVKAVIPPPRMTTRGKNRDMSKYCHFYKDYGHDTDYFRELRCQIKDAFGLGKLAHLVKGMRKGKAKAFDTQQGD
ncbi:hypothetical protein Tco_0736311, partial [Tanacetum coccineum]